MEEHYRLPDIPMFDVPEELKEYGEGACFIIVHEEPNDPNSPLKLLYAYKTIIE